MATREEIESLKEGWVRDACWDIEDTPGFEEHREELAAFHKQMNELWQQKEIAEMQSTQETYEAHLDPVFETEMAVQDIIDAAYLNDPAFSQAQAMVAIARILYSLNDSVNRLLNLITAAQSEE